MSFEFSLCSPSVLDRLNALLEPGGVLTINERGMVNGTTSTITPHPGFRYDKFLIKVLVASVTKTSIRTSL